jgi:low affinity Fe/Cu permease
MSSVTFIQEKREKGLVFNIDYHDTYTLDPKMWNVIIELLYLRKNEVVCISHDGVDALEEIQDSIGKVIGKENCYMTDGQAKMDWAKANGIDVDVWIDNNPIHIVQDPN